MAQWKKYARIILPHIGLIVLSVIYVICGALTFYHLERPNEIAIRKDNLKRIAVHRNEMLRDIWAMINDPNISDEDLEQLAMIHVDNVTRVLFDAFDTHFITASHLKGSINDDDCTWTFTTAVFFTTTLLTTIGYGNLVPVTFEGRMFCISYALFGVPLILITIADIGKFLSENIVFLYTRYSQAKRRWKAKKISFITRYQDDNVLRNQLIPFGLEQYISIPILLIVGILLSYMATGAITLASWEYWDFFTGFYFSFITMTTVGFGDIVPVKQEYYLLDLLYIIIGLAITTMCIDLVGIQYIRKIHYFGRAIQDARYALVNVGGKMVHVPDLLRYATLLQKKYGERKTKTSIFLRGPYIPRDYSTIRFIDYSTSTSHDSIQNFISNIFCRSNASDLEPKDL